MVFTGLYWSFFDLAHFSILLYRTIVLKFEYFFALYILLLVLFAAFTSFFLETPHET